MVRKAVRGLIVLASRYLRVQNVLIKKKNDPTPLALIVSP